MIDTIKIVIYICIITALSIGTLTSIGILFLIYQHRRQFSIDTGLLLSCNTYIAIIFSCLPLIDLYAYNLYGDLHEYVLFDNWWCYVRPYLFLIGFCSIYNSYFLQACFRLFRVVFYKFRKLQGFYFMFQLVLIQWLFAFITILPVLVLHHFEYLPEYHNCQITFYNFRGLIISSIPVYGFPMTCIGLIYLYIIHYIKQNTSSTIQQHRQRSNRRDTVVVGRIIILIGILTIPIFPFTILYIVYIATGYIHPLTYHLRWLTLAITLLILPISSARLTPQLYEVFTVILRRNRHITPIIIIPQRELNQRNALM